MAEVTEAGMERMQTQMAAFDSLPVSLRQAVRSQKTLCDCVGIVKLVEMGHNHNDIANWITENVEAYVAETALENIE